MQLFDPSQNEPYRSWHTHCRPVGDLWVAQIRHPGHLALDDAALVAGWSWHGDGPPLWAWDLIEEPCRANVECLLALDGRAPIGYLRLRVTAAQVELADLVVDPDRRRQGVASLLVAQIALQRRLLAVVSEWNVAGQCFLRSAGFTGPTNPRATRYRFVRCPSSVVRGN